MRGVKLLTGVLLLIFLPAPLLASYGGNNGGKGLMYIYSARSLKKGRLELYLHSRFFGKVGKFQLGATPAVTFWDVQGSFSLTYGVSEKIELGLTPIVYQDNHKGGKGYNAPDDLFLKLKLGSLSPPNSSMQYGVLLIGRFPTGKYHNIIYEPYTAGTVEFGIAGLASYAQDPLYPQDAVNYHLNLGYIFHNDAGDKLTDLPQDTVAATSISTQLFYGVGLRYPTYKWDFSIEIYGNAFIQRPVKTAYSRENYLYLSPGVTYKAYKWLSLDFAADFRLTPDNDKTTYGFVHKLAPNMPASYPDWRVNLGVKLVLLPTSIFKEDEREILLRKAETRRELFEQIIREQRETEAAEKELERIKEERRKAEKELERLRRLLEGETLKKKEPEKQQPAPEKKKPEKPKQSKEKP